MYVIFPQNIFLIDNTFLPRNFYSITLYLYIQTSTFFQSVFATVCNHIMMCGYLISVW